MQTWHRSVPAWRTTLVTASWMMRNADRSMSAGSGSRLPRQSTSTRTPASRVVAASRSMSARPGAGPSGACPGPGSRLGAPQPGHHPPQSGQRLPAGGLDGGQGVARLVGTGVEDTAARARLDRDDADAVRHACRAVRGRSAAAPPARLGGRLGPHQLGPGLRLPDRMSDQPGNDREKEYGDRDKVYRRPAQAAAPERTQRGHCQERNQQAGGGHRRHRSPRLCGCVSPLCSRSQGPLRRRARPARTTASAAAPCWPPIRQASRPAPPAASGAAAGRKPAGRRQAPGIPT